MNRLRDGRAVDPVLLEIVTGSLASIEMEVETAIGRTSRSPMIRDAHDFRAGIHDRLLRKLTGRSYSALVHPVARDFPLDTMRPGDVFFHNDVYRSEGGIGHLPDLCVTVPVFDQGIVVAFVQAFGHHDDIGGAVPGSMPSHATSVFEEGLMVPPIKLWDQGEPNRAALAIMTRNSRMPESLAADLDAECSACLMGSRRLAELFDRYGRDTVEACFDAIVSGTAETFRREILAKIPTGTWTWEDYAEHDGVDEPRLHTQRITLTKVSDPEPKLIVDFTGTGPQARGPINHCGDYADGNFLKKWLAPILRNLADSPERMAELDVNEGVVELIEMRFPPPGTLLTPVFPAPTNARTFVILRLLGVLAGVVAKAVDGRMPADQETIRYTGVYGTDDAGEPYLMREVLGGGSGGRYYADGEDTIHVVPDSRNLPTEFTEARFPFLVERLGLAVDSGGAGQFRGGLGYEKHIRMRRDAHFMSIADRSILACWGVKGGGAGQPFQVTVDPGGPDEHDADALVDAEFVPAGTVIRIRTTGGGGWGDPLDRDVAAVVRDVLWGKVSRDAAARDYGVVIDGPADDPVADEAATDARRSEIRAARTGDQPFFDRGPGYARLSGGATHADCDLIPVDVMTTAGVPERSYDDSGRGPLADLLVVDLTRALAGPHAGMMLGDLGARVIKVESPAGDDSRGWGPPFVSGRDGAEHSTYFLSCNRNKESIVLDLKSVDGREVLTELVRRADVLLENFRPGVLDRLGFGEQRLHELNPGLVIVSITGFGHDGPEGGRAGYDQIAQGEGGLMSMTGPSNDEPTRVGVPIADLLAGMYAAYGALAALHERTSTGRGRVVRTSLLASIVGVHAFQGTRFTVAGEVPGVAGSHHPSICPYGLFHSADGPVQISVGSEGLWRRFALEFGVDQPQWATNHERVRDRPALVDAINAAFDRYGSAELLDILDRIGVPAGRVRNLAEVYGWEQTRSQGLLIDVEHSALGRITLPGPPLRFDASEFAGGMAQHGPPPTLDEHGAAIRAWLGIAPP